MGEFMRLDYDSFKSEMKKLEKASGTKSTSMVLVIFTEVLKWLRINGHGNLILSAKDHSFSKKFKAETIVTAEGNSLIR